MTAHVLLNYFIVILIFLGYMCIYHREENLWRTESPIWRVYVVLNEILCRIGPCVLLVTLNLLMIRDFRTSIKRRKELKNGLYKGGQKGRKHHKSILNVKNNNKRHGGKLRYVSHSYQRYIYKVAKLSNKINVKIGYLNNDVLYLHYV